MFLMRGGIRLGICRSGRQTTHQSRFQKFNFFYGQSFLTRDFIVLYMIKDEKNLMLSIARKETDAAAFERQ